MCNENKPCNNGEKCDNSECTAKVNKKKLLASKAEKKSIIDNNKLVKK